MKIWYREQYGDTFKRVQRIEADLNKLEDVSSIWQLTSQELITRKNLQQELWTAALSHESLMRQKARVRWLKEGDCNSHYFHLMNSRRSNTAVKGLHIEGAWNNDPTTVKEEVLRFFSNKFRESDHSRPVLDGVRFRGISQHQNDLLVGAFTHEEIRAAV